MTEDAVTSYRRLMREHATIEAFADDLVDIVQGPASAAEAALATVRRLAMMIRDHHANEEHALAATVDAAAGDRHRVAAMEAMRDVVAQDEDWSAFVYRWCPEAIAARWDEFGADTRVMVDRMRRRHAREMDILYSLGVHYRVLETVEG